MTPERWTQIEELFHSASECAPHDRGALLDEACQSDPDLRGEVEALLAGEENASEHLYAAVRDQLESVGFPLIGETISHYRIIDGLANGGMGLVYRAEDIKLGRRVALKFLPEESVKDSATLGRFEREARAASALEHPNICPIYEFGEHKGQPFLVMQLLEGQTLRELIAATGPGKPPLEFHKLLDLAVQIVEGLDAAHQKGIIHRDIKPANIFITREGQAKILDFGLAKLASLARAPSDSHIPFHSDDVETSQEVAQEPVPWAVSDLSISLTGVLMGTAGYMSPEQVRGVKLDTRTDLFSFGLVLYEMATGQRAFKGDTALVLHDVILNHIPVSARKLNPEVPSKLEEILNKALEKDREVRYQTASEIRSDLKCLNRENNSGQVNAASTAAKTAGRSRRIWVIAGLILFLILGAGTTWRIRRQPPSRALNSGLAAILSFEVQPSGGKPAGWSINPLETVFADDKVVHGGRWSARIERKADSPGTFTYISRFIPMTFSGTSIELRGFLRTEDVSGFAGLWMREDGESGESRVLEFDNMEDRGLKGTTTWYEYSITLPVRPEAKRLLFGVIVTGTGKAWADDLQLLVDGKPIWEAPKLERPK